MGWIGGLILISFVFAPAAAIYLWLAANFRAMSPSQRFVLRMLYFLWLIVPVLILFAGRGEPGTPDQVDRTVQGTAALIALALVVAVLPYALWRPAQWLTWKRNAKGP